MAFPDPPCRVVEQPHQWESLVRCRICGFIKKVVWGDVTTVIGPMPDADLCSHRPVCKSAEEHVRRVKTPAGTLDRFPDHIDKDGKGTWIG